MRFPDILSLLVHFSVYCRRSGFQMQREGVLHTKGGIQIGTVCNVNGISCLKNMKKYVSVWHLKFSHLWLCKLRRINTKNMIVSYSNSQFFWYLWKYLELYLRCYISNLLFLNSIVFTYFCLQPSQLNDIFNSANVLMIFFFRCESSGSPYIRLCTVTHDSLSSTFSSLRTLFLSRHDSTFVGPLFSSDFIPLICHSPCANLYSEHLKAENT
jgi:hypothetical protein